MATLIKVNGDQIEIQDTELETLQNAVGGYIEIVNLPNDMILVVDEEGAIKNKEINLKASFLYGDRIFGDVVFCKNDEVK